MGQMATATSRLDITICGHDCLQSIISQSCFFFYSDGTGSVDWRLVHSIDLQVLSRRHQCHHQHLHCILLPSPSPVTMTRNNSDQTITAWEGIRIIFLYRQVQRFYDKSRKHLPAKLPKLLSLFSRPTSLSQASTLTLPNTNIPGSRRPSIMVITDQLMKTQRLSTTVPPKQLS